MAEMMTCRTCETAKPLDQFSKHKRSCKACLAAKARARYAANPSTNKEAQKAWRERNIQYRKRKRREWYENNRDHAIAYARRYASENRESGRAYHARNRDRRLAQAREWKARNKEHVNQTSREWYWNNVDRARATSRLNAMAKRAAENGVAGVVTVDQVAARVEFYGHKCYLCGEPYSTIDHVKPLAAGGANLPANLRPACKSCNSKKKDRWPYAPALRRRPC